ncbi:MAG: hypothetical protein ABIV06_11260 [Thermoanaerobaculia bacterium]
MHGISMSRQFGILCSLVLAFIHSAAKAENSAEFSLGTGFNYQGRLQQAGSAAEGRFDFSFELYDAARGGRSFGRIDRLDIVVRAGGFVAELDFGRAVFSGDKAWLEIQVRPAGEGAFTVLEPRHLLAGESVSLCTVDSDVLINGTLSVGVPSASAPLQLPGIPDVEPGFGGAMVLGSITGTNLSIDGNEIMARFNGQPSTLLLNNDGGTVVFGGPIDIGYQIVEQSVFGIGVAVDCPTGLKVLGGGCRSADANDHLLTSRPSIVGARNGWLCTYNDVNDSELTAFAICANVQ